MGYILIIGLDVKTTLWQLKNERHARCKISNSFWRESPAAPVHSARERRSSGSLHIRRLLEDLRSMWSKLGAGLTSITHSVVLALHPTPRDHSSTLEERLTYGLPLAPLGISVGQ